MQDVPNPTSNPRDAHSRTSRDRRNTKLSRPSTNSAPSSPAKGSRFPVWTPVLIMAAVFLTGLVLAWSSSSLPTGFYVLFVAAMIITTLVVEPRGLFLTVVSFPLWYFFGMFLIRILTPPQGSTGYSSQARLATAVYPAVEEFLWLLIPFIICLAIAIARWWIYRERLDRYRARATQRRQWQSNADRSNQELARQIRSRTESRRPSSSISDTSPSQSEDYFESSLDEDLPPRSFHPQVRSRDEIRRASEDRRRSIVEGRGSSLPKIGRAHV